MTIRVRLDVDCRVIQHPAFDNGVGAYAAIVEHDGEAIVVVSTSVPDIWRPWTEQDRLVADQRL